MGSEASSEHLNPGEIGEWALYMYGLTVPPRELNSLSLGLPIPSPVLCVYRSVMVSVSYMS